MDKHMDKHTDEEKITLECEGDGHQDGEEKNCQQRVYDHLRTCGFWVWSRILLPLGQRLGQLVQDLRQPVRDLGQLAWKGMKGPVPQVDTNKHRLPCCVWTILVCGATFYIAVLIAWPVLVRRVDIGDAAWAQGEKSIFDLGGKSIAANEFKPVLAIPCYQDDGVDRRPVCDKKRRCGRFRMTLESWSGAFNYTVWEPKFKDDEEYTYVGYADYNYSLEWPLGDPVVETIKKTSGQDYYFNLDTILGSILRIDSMGNESGTNISIYSDNLVDVNILVGLHRSKAIEYNVRAYEDLPRLPSLFGSPGGGDIVCVTMDQKLTDFNITKLAQRYEIPIPEEGLQSSFIYLTASGPTTQVFRRIEPLQFPVLLNSMVVVYLTFIYTLFHCFFPLKEEPKLNRRVVVVVSE